MVLDKGENRKGKKKCLGLLVLANKVSTFYYLQVDGAAALIIVMMSFGTSQTQGFFRKSEKEQKQKQKSRKTKGVV